MVPLLAANAAAGLASKAADAMNSLWGSGTAQKSAQSSAAGNPTSFASVLAGQGLDVSSITQAPLLSVLPGGSGSQATGSQAAGSSGKTVNQLA